MFYAYARFQMFLRISDFCNNFLHNYPDLETWPHSLPYIEVRWLIQEDSAIIGSLSIVSFVDIILSFPSINIVE